MRVDEAEDEDPALQQAKVSQPISLTVDLYFYLSPLSHSRARFYFHFTICARLIPQSRKRRREGSEPL